MNTLIPALGFIPKENSAGIFCKKYSLAGNYAIEVDFEKERIDYGNRIEFKSKTTQNFSQAENWVVLECVDRLLMKGYRPEDITLEKVYPSGHGTSGRLDILVKKEGKAYLMIECKTWGKEFDKEWQNTQKKGGQLLSYLQQDRDAEFLVLYASHFDGKNIRYRNEIIKVEEDYRLMASNTEDLYNRWNKLSKQNGLFDGWVSAYHFESKALTPELLKPIKQEDSSFIFNRFLEILRHNTVSDKGNAFNKIFTLFLCKVYDEKTTKNGDELRFQWLEGKDTHISFQIRLTDLYKNGMLEFLEKQVTDFSEDDFENKYKSLDDSIKKSLLEDFFRVRLQKNNEFAIKDVFDEQSFEENAKVVKEVVELLQEYRIRYNKRQQYLSDFFELLLTTGLKQESGQFFTPVPVAQFIIKSLPIDRIIEEKITRGERNNLLPYIIDYAAGSGHFLTESMHEIQGIINEKKPSDFIPDTARKLKAWQEDHFDWATQYVYGVEKDYRLVKVGKVGCYLHGDGLANVILSDGLARFDHKEYKGKLAVSDADFPLDNKQFDIVVSNPPYSVSSFVNTSRSYYTEKDFELYSKLTDTSSEIECLFIERTKQLLKDGGIAGIILPSSILNNGGIYTRAREIILDYFEIVGITELGSNTFMATGTNTVVLFLRRRNNYDSINLRKAAERYATTLLDTTQNGIEKPVSKYVSHVWEGIRYDDYITLLQKSPNSAITAHEIYQSYEKKLSAKNPKELLEKIVEREKEKIYSFIMAYPQTVVLVKSGEKDAEKRFLGYEFSNRRGSEGIHPIQKGKTIDECTRLFDPDTFENPEKASMYIYQAFGGDFETPIHESLSGNISRHRLVDMMNFDRADFEKTISLSVKKKIKIESKWEVVKLGSLASIITGKKDANFWTEDGEFPFFTCGEKVLRAPDYSFDTEAVLVAGNGRVGECKYYKGRFEVYQRTYVIDKFQNIHPLYCFFFLRIYFPEFAKASIQGSTMPYIKLGTLSDFQIPLPPLDIQQKIVEEMEILEKRGEEMKEEVEKLQENIQWIYISGKEKYPQVILSNEIEIIGWGTPKTDISEYWNGDIPWLSVVDFKDSKRFVWKTEKSITEAGLNKSSTKLLNAGDLIISARGTVGALAQLSVPMAFNQSCYGIRPKQNLLAGYLFYALKFEVEQFRNNSYGAIFDTITTKTFDLIRISLPPLSEQQKIVAEIERIEAEIETLEIGISEMPKRKEEVLRRWL